MRSARDMRRMEAFKAGERVRLRGGGGLLMQVLKVDHERLELTVEFTNCEGAIVQRNAYGWDLVHAPEAGS
jgi:hypothetical protein